MNIAIATVNGESGLNIECVTKYTSPVLLLEMLSEREIQQGGQVTDEASRPIRTFFAHLMVDL